jgi:hypothetical protein
MEDLKRTLVEPEAAWDSLPNELDAQHLATSPTHFTDAPLFVVLKNSEFEASWYFRRYLNDELRAVR